MEAQIKEKNMKKQVNWTMMMKTIDVLEHIYDSFVRPKEFRMHVFEEKHGYKVRQKKRQAKAAKVENTCL